MLSLICQVAGLGACLLCSVCLCAGLSPSFIACLSFFWDAVSPAGCVQDGSSSTTRPLVIGLCMYFWCAVGVAAATQLGHLRALFTGLLAAEAAGWPSGDGHYTPGVCCCMVPRALRGGDARY